MGRSRLPACYLFFRMEFIQHLDYYEHAKCVELYGWKCYICCVEAKDQVGLEMQHIGDGIVYTVKPTLVSTQEKKTLGTVNYAEQAGEDDLEEIPGNEIQAGNWLHFYTCAQVHTKWVMIVFPSEKRKKPDPKPVQSSGGKVFIRKPPSKPLMASPIPVIIQPTDEGVYQLPA